NLGGLLTPLGDPPLFLGFLRGIDFFWTMRLWPEWLVANGLVLAVFLLWDTLAFARETPADLADAPVRIHFPGDGRVNFVLLAGILLVVLLQSASVAAPLSQWLQPVLPGIDVQVRHGEGALLMIGLALASLLVTPRGVRHANNF